MTAFPKLTSLDLSYTYITDNAIASLTSLPRLSSLDLTWYVHPFFSQPAVCVCSRCVLVHDHVLSIFLRMVSQRLFAILTFTSLRCGQVSAHIQPFALSYWSAAGPDRVAIEQL